MFADKAQQKAIADNNLTNPTAQPILPARHPPAA